MVIRLSQAEHARVSAAVAEAERRTSGEIAVVVAEDSDRYHDAVLHWAILAMFLALAALALLPAETFHSWLSLLSGWQTKTASHRLILAGLFLLLGSLFLAVRYAVGLTRLRYRLVPAATKTRRVRRRAIGHFRVGTERRTAGRTGVLIYVSLAEHRAEIVADAAIHGKVPPEAWGAAMTALIGHVKADRTADGLVEAIGQVGALLAAHFPPSEANPNEVPDRLVEI